MLKNLQIGDKVTFKNEEIYCVHKITKMKNPDRSGEIIYGLGLQENCHGDLTWYHENGSPLTFWANDILVKTIFEQNTIMSIKEEN